MSLSTSGKKNRIRENHPSQTTKDRTQMREKWVVVLTTIRQEADGREVEDKQETNLQSIIPRHHKSVREKRKTLHPKAPNNGAQWRQTQNLRQAICDANCPKQVTERSKNLQVVLEGNNLTSL